MSATWTGTATLLAGDIREPGFGAAETNARAWQARCHPEATRGLVAAALILTCGDAGSALWAAADPCPDDMTLLAWCSELKGHIADLLEHCRRMTAACEAEQEAAAAGHADAASAARNAQAHMAAAATPELHAAAEADYEAAAERARAAATVLADCEAALEILHSARGRLDTALKAVRCVPDDLQAAYETPYQFKRDGGVLPWSGDFLTENTRTPETIKN